MRCRCVGDGFDEILPDINGFVRFPDGFDLSDSAPDSFSLGVIRLLSCETPEAQTAPRRVAGPGSAGIAPRRVADPSREAQDSRRATDEWRRPVETARERAWSASFASRQNVDAWGRAQYEAQLWANQTQLENAARAGCVEARAVSFAGTEDLRLMADIAGAPADQQPAMR